MYSNFRIEVVEIENVIGNLFFSVMARESMNAL